MPQRLAAVRRTERGFTLVELLIVIVILGVLAGIVVLAVGAFQDRGQSAACKANVKITEEAVEAYKAKTAGYPATLDALTADGYLRELPNVDGATGDYHIVYNPADGSVDGIVHSDGSHCGAVVVAQPTPTQTDEPSVPDESVSLFSTSTVPTNPSWDDANAVEVGVRFFTDVPGQVVGIRFYKGATNAGPHSGTLWSPGGSALASATFGAESSSGWQTALFSSPVSITAGSTYTASYFTSVGFYAVDLNMLGGGYASGPLHVPAGGGAYHYWSGGYPDSTANHNYWVDVLFVPSA